MIRQDFDSLPALLDWIAATPCDWDPKRPLSDRRGPNARNFTGSDCYADAAAMARGGWPEGAAAFDEALQGLVQHLAPARPRRTGYDRAGDELDTCRLFARDPEPFAVYTKRRKAKRVHRIAVGSMSPWTITTAERTAYFTGLAALVTALERAGDSVEVTLVIHAEGSGAEPVVRVRIKEAWAPLEPAALAFPLVHSSMFRRIGFAAFERMVPWSIMGDGGFVGYGYAPRALHREHGELATPTLDDETLAAFQAQGAEDFWSSWWRNESQPDA